MKKRADRYPLFQRLSPGGADVSGVTATAPDVDDGKIFVDNTGEQVVGTSTYKADYIALRTDIDNLNDTLEPVLLGDGSDTNVYANVSNVTATANDVAQGKVFVNSSGQEVTGTSSGGGLDTNLVSIIERKNNQSSFTIPSGITEIGGNLFHDYYLLTNITIPNTVTKIGSNAFYGCYNLQLTSLPDSVTWIGWGAFQECSSITLTDLPSGLTLLGNSAFNDCTGLTSITFHSTPTMYPGIFNNCSNLTTIRVPWQEGEVANAPWGAVNSSIIYGYTPS